MKKPLLPGILMLMFTLFSCATMMVSASSPVIGTAANDAFDLRLEPLSEGKNYFSIFRLTIVNKTDQPIEIDWNKTRYLLNGKSADVFIYAGVTAEQLKNSAVLLDTIPGGGTLTRKIAPVRKVAWAPIRSDSVKAGESGFSAGVLPDGENGILLIGTHNGKTVREKATVVIKSQPAGK